MPLKILSAIVAVSSMGNVLAVLFTQGRGKLEDSFVVAKFILTSLLSVIQELGREGILPFSSFFGSNKPYDTPMAGLFTQWFMTSLLVSAIPQGDAYLFMLNGTSNRRALLRVLNPPQRHPTHYPS